MASTSKVELPDGFLSGPAPNLTKRVIDFKKEGIPQYDGRWAVILDGVLSQEECDTLIKAAEMTSGGQWERAMVNVGAGQQRMIEDTRKCGRIIWDDRDVVGKIWTRVADSVQDIHQLNNWADVTGAGPAKRKETWKATRLNERMRFLKYVGGEYFKAHNDGSYETPDGKERSYFTLHLYLNDAEGQLEGGATSFYDYNMTRKIDVMPKSGRILMFQHRNLLHSGDDVANGIKYTMRTDLMYTKADQNGTVE